MKIDYLIVGQGLAGSWLSYFLLKKGKTVKLVDKQNPNAASLISSGLVNPITGHKLIKTWKSDSILEATHTNYQEIEAFLGGSFYRSMPIVWLLNNVQQFNRFLERSGEEEYKNYISIVEPKQFSDQLININGYAKVRGAAQINTANFIESYRAYLIREGLLIDELFCYEDLALVEEGAYWKGIEANKIIFCEGYKCMENPFFNWLPFVPAKGEILLVDIPSYKHNDVVIKHKHFLVPWKDRTYWFGSNYEWKEINELATSPLKEYLTEQLNKTLTVPYTIVDHIAGIRPSGKSRRPFIGIHPKHKQLGVFNGLGTKGIGMSTYFGNLFAEYLENGMSKFLDEEVQIIKHYNNIASK